MDIFQQAKAFALQWIDKRHGSTADFLGDIERDLGWAARMMVPKLLEGLRKDTTLTNEQHKFVIHTLNEQEIGQALARESDGVSEHQSALDELFNRGRKFRHSEKFQEAVDFVAKFRDYSPFNNMLVYLQNPHATYVATTKQWFKIFRRTIKEDARPIIILAPKTPVLLLYDVGDTEGPALPANLENFGRTSGGFDPGVLQRTLKNCERESILVERKELPELRPGLAAMRLRNSDWSARVLIRKELDDVSAYAVLCHELAHVFLGHLGASKKCNWPYRPNTSHAVAELEAEAVSYIVCRRAGLKTQSVQYVSGFLEDSSEFENISLDLISRVAGRIEQMGYRLLPPR
ncbi:MAG: hypothetical protein JWO95_2500 [Verrucomicrobiales bacterium]|nr:hypothetical protein [Verrucomicrobiales bacterium]